MAVDPARQEELRRIQQELAKYDTSILELDPTDEEDALSIEITYDVSESLNSGEEFTLVVEGLDGAEDHITIVPTGKTPEGGMSFNILTYGQLSPAGLDVLEGLLSVNHEEEIARITGG
jgi:hypothetical protein